MLQVRYFGNREYIKYAIFRTTFQKALKDSQTNCPQEKRISEETKASTRVLKLTTSLTSNEVAERFQVSTASVRHITSSNYKEVHKSKSHFSGRKKKLIPEHDALILTTNEELREQEGSFSSSDGADRNSS